MNIRALVVDDEPRARARMRRLLEAHPDVEVVGEAEDGEGAVAAVLAHRPSVVFLDVQMPGATGLDAVRTLHATVPEPMRPLVIFTTAHEEHAVEAFALEGTDYLLKPVERDRLAEALRRVRKVLWAAPAAAPVAPPPAPLPPPAMLSAVRRGRVVPLAVEDVAAVVLEDTIAFAHTPEGRLRLKLTMLQAEERLADHGFVRVSRSALVALDWIHELKPGESGTFVAALKEPVELEISVSRRRARRLRELLGW